MIALLAGLAMDVAPATDQEQAPPPAEATPAPPPKPPPTEPPDDGHFRWGLSPMFGTFFPGPTTVALGLEVRIGWAFNQIVTAYGSLGSVAGIGFGADVSGDDKSVSVSAISYWYLGANVDALLAGPLFVGGGAAIGKAGWGVVEAHGSSSGGGSDVIAAAGWTPSLDARLGISTGTPSLATGKRSGFYLALDVRVLFAPNATETREQANASSNSASGSAKITTDTTAVGIAPMLHLGFDSR